MNPGNWIALLGIAVSVLGLAVTVLLFALNRLLGKLDAAALENKVLTAANWDLKLALAEFKGMGRTLDRTLSALPAAPAEGKTP